MNQADFDREVADLLASSKQLSELGREYGEIAKESHARVGSWTKQEYESRQTDFVRTKAQLVRGSQDLFVRAMALSGLAQAFKFGFSAEIALLFNDAELAASGDTSQRRIFPDTPVYEPLMFPTPE